jgi:hypothetical protein
LQKYIDISYDVPLLNLRPLEVLMYIGAVDSDATDWELKDPLTKIGNFNKSPVCVLDEKSIIHSVQLNTGINEGFSLKNRKIEPTMGRVREISLEYTHTNSDGSSDTIKGGVKLDEDRGYEADRSTSESNENDNRASDVDSRDRDYDRDTNDK